VRKYLGVLAGAAVLCVMSWAQAPAAPQTPDQTQTQAPDQTPAPAPVPPAAPIPTTPTTIKNRAPGPQYPRLELFAGGTYAEAGLFNSGHWAGLRGWDASLAANANSWIGVVVEGGEYFGTSKISTLSPEPFPSNQFFQPSPSPTFNVATREYNILFGLQFARRKYGRWTPIGEILYGHQGTRGVATPLTIPGTSSPLVAKVGAGRAIVAGGGLEHAINSRFAVRFKADYFQTGSQFPTFAKKTQDNFRFSVGVVIRNVHKKKRTLEDDTEPEP
jgi:hypothetical protein